MKLTILGSSSKGNCYLLDDGEQCLVLECGISFKQVKQALNFDVMRVVGALVSHEHGDHAKYAPKFIESNIPVYASRGTIKAMGIDRKNAFLSRPLEPLKTTAIGNFKVFPFDTQHDAAQPFGFLIYHPQMGKMLFATDTYFLQYTFDGLNNILIECNYREDILQSNVLSGKLLPVMARRTTESHMAFKTCLEVLSANDLSGVNNIVLIHLSDTNSNADEFQRGIQEETCKTVTIARPGVVIDNFNKSPF